LTNDTLVAKSEKQSMKRKRETWSEIQADEPDPAVRLEPQSGIMLN
jgi:hypothetical protein